MKNYQTPKMEFEILVTEEFITLSGDADLGMFEDWDNGAVSEIQIG